jgi:ribosome assembly protein 3
MWAIHQSDSWRLEFRTKVKGLWIGILNLQVGSHGINYPKFLQTFPNRCNYVETWRVGLGMAVLYGYGKVHGSDTDPRAYFKIPENPNIILGCHVKIVPLGWCDIAVQHIRTCSIHCDSLVYPNLMPPRSPKRKRQRKRKRRNDVSSSSSETDSDSDNDSITQQRTGSRISGATQQPAEASDSNPATDSSGSSSSSEEETLTQPSAVAKHTNDVEMAEVDHPKSSSARRDSHSPSPPPTKRDLPSFLSEDADSQAEKAAQQQLKEKFRKFWMERMAAGFKGDLEQIRKVLFALYLKRRSANILGSTGTQHGFGSYIFANRLTCKWSRICNSRRGPLSCFGRGLAGRDICGFVVRYCKCDYVRYISYPEDRTPDTHDWSMTLKAMISWRCIPESTITSPQLLHWNYP